MKKGYVYIILSAVLFSTMEITLKVVSIQFNPIQLTFIRFLIGSLILAPLAVKNLKAKGLSLQKEDFKFFMITGFICVVVSMTFFQLAILYCKASIVAIIFSCNPVFVIPFAHFILKEKVYKQTIISMVISIVGIIFIMNPFNMVGSATGILFTILSALTFALYGVVGKAKSQKYGGVVMSSFSFLMGSIEMLILMLLTKISFISTLLTDYGLKVFANIPLFQGITLHNIPYLVYIGVFVTGLGYTFYFLAMEETSASTASVVFFIKPALAPVLALIIINESITPNTIAGIIIIIIGSYITFVSNSRRISLRSNSKLE